MKNSLIGASISIAVLSAVESPRKPKAAYIMFGVSVALGLVAYLFFD